MNRTTLISIGIIIVIFIAGIWGYLMLFGTPKNTGEVYTNLGFNPISQPVTITTPEVTTEGDSTQIATSGRALSQLTTRAVAGFGPVTASSSNAVRYLERGTGHMYEIDLTTGLEVRLSPTTIAQAGEAIFNTSADMVAITVDQNYTSKLTLGRLNENSLNLTPISNNADNIEFINNNTLAYTESQNGITVGYHYDTTLDTKEKIFDFAFSEIDVWWGRGDKNTYILSKPAPNLDTYSYELFNNKITRAFPKYPEMAGFTNFVYSVITYKQDNSYRSYAVDTTDNNLDRLPVLSLSQKCSFDEVFSNYLWCGAPATASNDSFVDDWYKGVAISEDMLWLINLTTQSAELLSNPTKEAGRALDIVNVKMNQTGDNLFFLNRTDRTLWRYNLKAE